MDLCYIKENSKIENLIQDYFFKKTNEIKFEEDYSFFIESSLISPFYKPSHFFNIPFKILMYIFLSRDNLDIRLTKNICIPPQIWKESFFKSAKIKNLDKKIKFLVNFNSLLESYLLSFKAKNFLSEKLTEKFYKDLNEKFFSGFEFLLEEKNISQIYNIKDPKTFKLLNERSIKEDNSSRVEEYFNTLLFFLKNSVDLYNIFNVSMPSNFESPDYDDSLNFEACDYDTACYYRINITKFYAVNIIPFIVKDVMELTLTYLLKTKDFVKEIDYNKTDEEI